MYLPISVLESIQDSDGLVLKIKIGTKPEPIEIRIDCDDSGFGVIVIAMDDGIYLDKEFQVNMDK